MAGLRPGFGRGGIIHSFEVTEPGVPGPGEEADADARMEGLHARGVTEGVVLGEGAIDGGAGVAIMSSN